MNPRSGGPCARRCKATASAVVTAVTAADGLAQVESFSPDLILLDLGLPDVDGQRLLGEIRRRIAAPVIVLSVRGAERDKIAALDNGADDYLTKPFGIGELLARIRVALRHRGPPAATAATDPLVVRRSDARSGRAYGDAARHAPASQPDRI